MDKTIEYTPEDLAVTRAWLISLLKDHKMEINFNKKDGTSRKMLCTLIESELPKRDIKESTVTKKVNEEIISAYDLEKEGWRSFRLDSLTSFKFSIGE